MRLHIAVKTLLEWQPDARSIRAERCHCERRARMLSYTVPQHERVYEANGQTYEDCGYWCAGCDFSNAGAREHKPRGENLGL